LASRPAVAVALIAFLIRAAVGWMRLDQLDVDVDAYRVLAETLASHGVFGLVSPSGEVIASAYRPPLYPMVLSLLTFGGSVNNLAVAILHAFLGGLTALCTYLAVVAWLGKSNGQLPGIVAAIVVIVDPILVQQSTLPMTETLATAIASVVIWWWMAHVSNRFSIVSTLVLGGLLALGFLCRPTFVVWAFLLVIGLFLTNTPKGMTRRRRLLAAGSTAICVALVIGAWTYRNLTVLGHPIWATTHGGYTLLLGNNPHYYRHLREAGPFLRWDPNDFLTAYAHRFEGDPSTRSFWFRDWQTAVPVQSELGQRELGQSGTGQSDKGQPGTGQPGTGQPEASSRFSEADDDKLTYDAAAATIRRNPGIFVTSCLVRVYRLWTPLPYAAEQRALWQRLAIGAYYTLLYAAALLGLAKMGSRLRSSIWWPIPALLLALTLVHAVYWSNMRMRAPAIPAIAMLAGLSLQKKSGVGC
jgi:hypothetical protein